MKMQFIWATIRTTRTVRRRTRRDRLTDQSDSTAVAFIGVITWCAFFLLHNESVMVVRESRYSFSLPPILSMRLMHLSSCRVYGHKTPCVQVVIKSFEFTMSVYDFKSSSCFYGHTELNNKIENNIRLDWNGCGHDSLTFTTIITR